MQTFEDYLQDIHAAQYCGLDDDMIEDFYNWLEQEDTSDLIEYAEKYGKEMYDNGWKAAMAHIKDKMDTFSLYETIIPYSLDSLRFTSSHCLLVAW